MFPKSNWKPSDASVKELSYTYKKRNVPEWYPLNLPPTIISISKRVN